MSIKSSLHSLEQRMDIVAKHIRDTGRKGGLDPLLNNPRLGYDTAHKISQEFMKFYSIPTTNYRNIMVRKDWPIMFSEIQQGIAVDKVARRCGILDNAVFELCFRHKYGISVEDVRKGLKSKYSHP